MYNYATYYWPAQELEGIALSQDTLGAASLVLNGLYSIPTAPTIDLLSRGFIRQVSLTSSNDLSAAIFTITGVQNSTVVTIVMNGPNNNTIETTDDFFDIITSVSVDRAVLGVKVGTGLQGFLPIFLIASAAANNFLTTSSFSPYSFSFNTESLNGCQYVLYESLSNLSNNGQTFTSMVNSGTLIQVGDIYLNETQVLHFSDVCYTVIIAVTSIDSSSTLQTQFLQL